MSDTSPEDDFAAARLPDPANGDVHPLLRDSVLQYVAGVVIAITYKDGRQVRVEGANLRVDAEVYIPHVATGIDVQEVPGPDLSNFENPKMHLVLQTIGQGTSTLVLKDETEPVVSSE